MTQAVEQEQIILVNVYEWPKDVDLIIERPEFPVTGSITLRLPDELFDRWQDSAGRWSDGVTVVTETREILITDPILAVVGGIPMSAGEEATTTLEFDAPVTGEYGVVLYEQIDGLTVGGVEYEWLVTDLTPPQVLAHAPVDEATNVPRNPPVVITFNEEMGPLNFDLILTPEVAGLQASWNDAGTVVTVTHPSFAPETFYVANVTASDASANAMAAPVIWSFTTGLGLTETIFKHGFEEY